MKGDYLLKRIMSAAEKYAEHCRHSVPGGVECVFCHEVNTLESDSVRYQRTWGNEFVFEQKCSCSKCGQTARFEWMQIIKAEHDGNQQSPR